MNFSSKLDRLYFRVKNNRWLRYFAVFNRVALAVGFIVAGIVKIMGERFAGGLSVNHPMGRYLEALYHTGYYYPFIGVMQVIAAILLLIPRTATLGAIIFFPIILNICILSFALRFEGSLLSSPLMVLANLYLLCWDYDKLKFIVSFDRPALLNAAPEQESRANKFPIMFFIGVAATVVILVLVVSGAYKIMPRNSLSDCQLQFKGTKRTKTGFNFCDCIHNQDNHLTDASMNTRKHQMTLQERFLKIFSVT